jgi:hypothetical protein
VAPEACSHPATPAVTNTAWRPRRKPQAALPPPPNRNIAFTPTNQRFESIDEYMQETEVCSGWQCNSCAFYLIIQIALLHQTNGAQI